MDLARLRAEFYERYLRVYREAESDAVKINALRAASDLFGLNAPLKTAHTTSKSTDMNLAREAVKGFTVEELRVFRRARDQMRQIASGGGGLSGLNDAQC